MRPPKVMEFASSSRSRSKRRSSSLTGLPTKPTPRDFLLGLRAVKSFLLDLRSTSCGTGHFRQAFKRNWRLFLTTYHGNWLPCLKECSESSWQEA